MMLKRKWQRRLAVALLLGLTGCGVVADEPYMLGRRLPGDGSNYEVGLLPTANNSMTGRPYFSLCYSRLSHKPEQILAFVQKHCGDPQLFYNSTDLYSCSLSAPVRATYSCSALSRTAEEARPNLNVSGSYLGTIQLY
ncbi:hypothetical protein [Ferrovibrio sp.]|uniref:hypothetical protein n=1 Tax=Ferrovibrio sp. TaxID=1917215 RepID=UPI000CB3BF26|nr:hypothetical protein [Ferrovibrio sp.]PJI42364.1 MAG: hypothetical protein CTR53_08065 [Ferrovibrio sp.]